MKLREDVLITEADGCFVAVPTQTGGFKGMIRMNETAGFLARRLQEETDERSLARALMEAYDVDEARAEESVKKLLDTFRKTGLLVEAE